MPIAPDEGVSYRYFSYFSMKTYVVGTHYKHLSEAFLMSTHSHVFVEKWERKINRVWKSALPGVMWTIIYMGVQSSCEQ